MITPCACIGRVGNDLYCPCEMKEKGLKSDSEWTQQDTENLNKVLSDIFKWGGE